MVTVSAGRNCSRTLRAARRVTVPSGISSPEQVIMPTFFLGRSGIFDSLFLYDQIIDYRDNFLRQDTSQFLPGFVEFGDALSLEILITTVHIQDSKLLCDCA